tara:strand:+ start:3320 stop:4918 length:1599 start_codon:yes stop_codon:yes gene_type:complete
MGIVNYVILAVTLLIVALFVIWYFKTRGPQQSLKPSMNKGDIVGIIPRYWKSIDVGIINAEINPIEKGQIDGNQNHPPSERTSLAKTEEKIKSRINSHYQAELTRIDEFKVLDSNKSLEDKFEDLEEVIEANGYKQQFDSMKQDWQSKKSLFANRIEEAITERMDAYDELNRFKRENSIPVTREPFAPSKILKFIKILIPVSLFSIEIYLNFGALKDATGIAQASYLSFTVAAINVGLSFLIGYLVLTHFFNPVNVTKKPRIIFYGFFFTLYTAVLVYLNFMLGVFRSLTNAAQEATTREISDNLTNEAFYNSVFPFDNLGQISFDGAFLLFMGFFFALITMIDGYFFNDPIPGYQKVGDNLASAKTRVKKLKQHRHSVFSVNQKNYEDGLKSWHDYRLLCVKLWGKYVNVVQGCVQKFKVFKGKMDETLKISTQNYRTANMEYRDTQAPAYFGNQHVSQFNESFNDAYDAIAEYNITDSQKRDIQSNFRKNINAEYEAMVSTYSQFFDNERFALDEFVKKLDDNDIRHKGI